MARRRSTLRRPAASLAHSATSPGAAKVSVAAIALELSALLMALAEAILPPRGLANGEVRRRTGRRGLPFRPRKRGSNQRTMNGPLFTIALVALFAGIIT